MDTKASLPEYPLRERAAPPREPFFRRILPFLSRRFWVIASTWIVTGLLINALLHMPGAGYSAAATILLSPRGDATPVDVDEPAAARAVDVQRIGRPIAIGVRHAAGEHARGFGVEARGAGCALLVEGDDVLLFGAFWHGQIPAGWIEK